MKEFYPSILEDSYITCKTIKDLDVLITENLIAENREKARKRYDYPVMDAHYFKSVLFINVPNHYKDAFLAEFRQFIKRHVVLNFSDNKMDEQELEGLKENYESLLVWYRSELMKDFQYEREHHQYVAGVYADLKVVEQNLISCEKDPFATPDVEEN
ncbi:hypothetical protein V2I71_09575 [Peribacillus frigoritolerans]|uniref:hypothetical protein n=1 Tax=Peribacillus frigoritolerans TaxID=450367 RepID=UPI002ED44B29|nr:hypothetical protein V2I71_09575 [Peribacillus frigoritolerans]